jgi:hypothetical protein
LTANIRVVLDGKEVIILSKNKKVLLGAVLVGVLLIGSVGGIAFAADNAEDAKDGNRFDAHWDRLCELYQEKTGTELDREALQDSFAEIRSEMREQARLNHPDRAPQTMQERLKHMVEEGMITQEQADEYQQWWDSKPDFGVGFGFRGHRGTCIPLAPPAAE